MAPLGDNLLWVATFDNATKSWALYDPNNTYTPEQLTTPRGPGPNRDDMTELSLVIPGAIYYVNVSENVTVALGGKERDLGVVDGNGVNIFPW